MSRWRTFGAMALLLGGAGATLPAALAAPGPRADARTGLIAASQRARAPVVSLMVAGPAHTLLGARRVRLAAERITVPGAGRCALAPGTALAALEAARRHRKLRYALRRQSACTPETLFVERIDGRANAGDGGWEYKVNGRTPAVGAAVPAGRGGARIHPGARVLWFYCLHANRCQGTLELRLAARALPGTTVTARVLARGDSGALRPVSGATVALPGSAASTDGSGSAQITVPAQPGRYPVTAAAPGLVDSFPEILAVG